MHKGFHYVVLRYINSDPEESGKNSRKNSALSIPLSRSKRKKKYRYTNVEKFKMQFFTLEDNGFF